MYVFTEKYTTNLKLFVLTLTCIAQIGGGAQGNYVL